MLILTRKPGESLYIGDTIKVTIVEIKGHQIRVGIEAPNELRIYREEIYLQILEENRAAAAAPSAEGGLQGLSEAWHGRTTGSSLAAGSVSQRLKGTQVGGQPEVIVRRKKPGS